MESLRNSGSMDSVFLRAARPVAATKMLAKKNKLLRICNAKDLGTEWETSIARNPDPSLRSGGQAKGGRELRSG
jgi:hypothetical protein